jgi:hypothetical protein
MAMNLDNKIHELYQMSAAYPPYTGTDATMRRLYTWRTKYAADYLYKHPDARTVELPWWSMVCRMLGSETAALTWLEE